MSRLIRNDKSKSKPAPQPQEPVKPLTSETIVAHLKSCQSIATEHAKSAFRVFLEDLDEAFSVDMDNARSNQEVSEISGIQRLFRRNREELERYYLGYIGEGFVKFRKKELHTEFGQSDSKGELSLVDNEELEETITISSITQKLDVYFAEPIWALNQRFAILNNGEQVTEASNPASPIQLCESLRRALRLIPLPVVAKSTAYRVYEQRLSDVCRVIIEDINEHLRSAGVLPHLKYEPPRKNAKPQQGGAPAQGAEQAAQAGPQAPPMPDPNQSTEEYQYSLVQAIRSLQQGMAGPGTAPGGVVGGRRATDQLPAGAAAITATATGGGQQVVLSAEQLLSVLQSMQGSAQGVVNAPSAEGQALAPVDFQAFFNTLGQQIQTSHQDNGKVSEADMGTIDLVGMVFEYMLKDENLPDSVKALLSYLHTPFLKLAFIDPGFFEQPEHPARLLLNNLAEAGTRWIGNDGSSQHDMYAKIKNIVDRVLKDFTDDIRVITELLLEFNSFTKSILRRQELMEKRAKEKAQGEERLREVKARVNDYIRERIDQKELPSAILLFVLQPWSDYLSFCLLRYGDKSERWVLAVQLVDDLLWVIEPKVKESDRELQTKLAKHLIEEIKHGFETIGYDQTKGNKLIDAVASLIEMAQQNERAEPAPAPMRDKLEKIAAEKAGQTEADLAADISAEEQKMVESLQMVEFGTWFEFEGGKRLKIAWHNKRTSHYMLVDQMGKQVAMMSGIEIARAMISKQAKIIAGSSKPFFERALENIFQKLNAQANAQTGGQDNNV